MLQYVIDFLQKPLNSLFRQVRRLLTGHARAAHPPATAPFAARLACRLPSPPLERGTYLLLPACLTCLPAVLLACLPARLQVQFFEVRLKAETAPLAKGFDAVCIFVSGCWVLPRYAG